MEAIIAIINEMSTFSQQSWKLSHLILELSNLLEVTTLTVAQANVIQKYVMNMVQSSCLFSSEQKLQWQNAIMITVKLPSEVCDLTL